MTDGRTGCAFAEDTNIILDGRYVSVTRKGQGKPVLLLHGYLSCKESFYFQIAALEGAGYRAVAPDMPGFGASQRLDEAWSVGDYARWLISFMDAEGLESPSVIAHSFGARVAFSAFSAHRERLSRLVVVGGAGIVKPRSKGYMFRVKAYRAVRKFFPAYAERHFGSREYRALTPVMKESYKKIVNEDLSAAAARISAPVLLVYGEDDKVTPYGEEGMTFRRLIPCSRLVSMEGDHFCFCNHSAQFNALALDFLGENT